MKLLTNKETLSNLDNLVVTVKQPIVDRSQMSLSPACVIPKHISSHLNPQWFAHER